MKTSAVQLCADASKSVLRRDANILSPRTCVLNPGATADCDLHDVLARKLEVGQTGEPVRLWLLLRLHSDGGSGAGGGTVAVASPAVGVAPAAAVATGDGWGCTWFHKKGW